MASNTLPAPISEPHSYYGGLDEDPERSSLDTGERGGENSELTAKTKAAIDRTLNMLSTPPPAPDTAGSQESHDP